jgi:hypothetical protein
LDYTQTRALAKVTGNLLSVGWTYWLRLTLLSLVAEARVDVVSCRSDRTLHTILYWKIQLLLYLRSLSGSG